MATVSIQREVFGKSPLKILVEVASRTACHAGPSTYHFEIVRSSVELTKEEADEATERAPEAFVEAWEASEKPIRDQPHLDYQ